LACRSAGLLDAVGGDARQSSGAPARVMAGVGPDDVTRALHRPSEYSGCRGVVDEEAAGIAGVRS